MNRFLPVVSRGFALALGGMTLLSSFAALAGRFDANLWWIDLRPIPPAIVQIICLIAAVTLLTFGISRRPGRIGCIVIALVCSVLLVFTIRNLVQFTSLEFRGAIHAGVWTPVSLFIGMGLLAVLIENGRGEEVRAPQRLASFALAGMLIASFPLVQMLCFGRTDYTRRADAAVVFGARAHADGHASQALSDRVLTACRLYRAGLVRKLVFSGGPGDGELDETQVMRRLALENGLDDSDILLDPLGLNTAATTRNTVQLFAEHGFHCVLAVSHFYHLPRVKLAYQQAGFEVYTVPAHGDRTLGGLGWFMAREVAADWVYYARGLIGASK